MAPAEILCGPYGGTADDIISRFSDCGANAVWFHGFNEKAFETCAQFNVAACVEFKTFRADFNTYPELVPMGVDGQPIRYGRLVQGVCLSNQDFLDRTEAALIEGLKTYNPAGVWLDYLTYTGWFEKPDPDLQDSCFCPACIREFCESTGIDADDPHRILKEYASAWEQHKCIRIAAYARHYADLIRASRPDRIVGAYMCPWQPHEFDRALTRIFAQDYKLLAGEIDIFTPLIYCQKSGRSPGWAKEFLEKTPGFLPAGSSVQLILDMLDFPASLMETAASKIPSRGIQVFGGAALFENEENIRQFGEGIEQIKKTWAQY